MHGTLYGQFTFARFRSDWHKLDRGQQTEHLNGIQFLLTRYPLVRVDQYIPMNSDPHCDFLLRFESDNPEALRDLTIEWQASDLFRYVEVARTMSGRTREPAYASSDQVRRLALAVPRPDLRRHAFLFSVTRTRDWWRFPEEERQRMVQEHVQSEMDLQPSLHRRCYYSADLDPQQDFVYYLEADEPALVEEAYDRAKGLRDANYWATHRRVFAGTPVTLEEWCEQVISPEYRADGWQPEPPSPNPTAT